MRLMGMSTWVYWSSWFVKYLLLMLIGVILLTILFHASISPNGPVITHSSPTVTFLFLFLYSLSVITFSFAVTTLVFKGKDLHVIIHRKTINFPHKSEVAGNYRIHGCSVKTKLTYKLKSQAMKHKATAVDDV